MGKYVEDIDIDIDLELELELELEDGKEEDDWLLRKIRVIINKLNSNDKIF
jgi:hypothetical protein